MSCKSVNVALSSERVNGVCMSLFLVAFLNQTALGHHMTVIIKLLCIKVIWVAGCLYYLI